MKTLGYDDGIDYPDVHEMEDTLFDARDSFDSEQDRNQAKSTPQHRRGQAAYNEAVSEKENAKAILEDLKGTSSSYARYAASESTLFEENGGRTRAFIYSKDTKEELIQTLMSPAFYDTTFYAVMGSRTVRSAAAGL